MKDIRVLIVIATFHPIVGGAEKQALEQGRSLLERGLEATIVTFQHNKLWPVHETMEGVPIIRVAGGLLGERDKLPRVLQKMLYVMALIVMGWTVWRYRHRYDVLHLYQLTLITLPTALACYLSGKPMLVAVRNADPGRTERSRDQVSGAGSSLDEAHRRTLRGDAESRGGDLADLVRLGKPVLRFTYSLLRRIDAVVVILSTRMREYLAAYGFTFDMSGERPQLLLIPNGVDIARFYPVSEDVADSERGQTVVCTARLCYQKGIDVLLQAWHLVHEELPAAHLIIAGPGPLEGALADMVRELGLGGSVEFVGSLSNVLPVLQRASIAALSSRWEGMPNAVLEAMACGLPCVATRVSGSEDIITHGVNGLLVEPEDYQSLAQALLVLLRDPVLTSAYGKAARATIEQDYPFEHITDMYLELYQRMKGDGKIGVRIRSNEAFPVL